jgi:ferredoxin
MSDRFVRSARNVPGPYFVNAEECIACEQCSEIAPDLFAHDEQGVSYVRRNPAQEPLQIEQFQQAREECPAGAIQEE